MQKIYSKVDGRLLHIIWRFADFKEGRQEVVPSGNFIQCSAIWMPDAGHTFKPHHHIERFKIEWAKIAQESWVVLFGSVKVAFYDIDQTIIAQETLYQFDASFTLYGGHTYEALRPDTIVYEYKTGPYEGRKKDKRFIL